LLNFRLAGTDVYLLVAIAAVVVMSVVMVVVAMEVAVMAAVPPVIVFDVAMISIPVTLKILPSIVVGSHPASALIRRPAPIARMPLVMVSYRVPITVDPYKIRARSCGLDPYHAGWGRRTNSNADGKLGAGYGYASQR
jgi:hypothetical protein